MRQAAIRLSVAMSVIAAGLIVKAQVPAPTPPANPPVAVAPQATAPIAAPDAPEAVAPQTAPAAQSQTAPDQTVTGGHLHGAVKSGAIPLPGVTITAQNTLTGKRYSTTSDITGAWSLTIPQNGRYVIRTQFAAFAQGAQEALLNATSCVLCLMILQRLRVCAGIKYKRLSLILKAANAIRSDV